MDSVMLPPTPPSSAGSDSDGSQSPQRSAPNSPQRQSPVRLYHIHQPHHANSPPLGAESSLCRDLGLSQPLFLSPVSGGGYVLALWPQMSSLCSGLKLHGVTAWRSGGRRGFGVEEAIAWIVLFWSYFHVVLH